MQSQSHPQVDPNVDDSTSEAVVTDHEVVSDHASLSYDDLQDAVREASAALLEANEHRDACVARLAALQDEAIARKRTERFRTYEEVRRAVAAKGGTPPTPPKGWIEPGVRAAASRLQGLSLTMKDRTDATTAPAASNDEGIESPVIEEAGFEASMHASSPGHPTALPWDPIEVGVTDHAVLRYLERVVGVDTDAIRGRILTPVVRSALAAGVERIRTSDGVVVARRGVVTSYLPSSNGPNRRRSQRRDDRRPPKARRLDAFDDLQGWSGVPGVEGEVGSQSD